MAKGKRMRTHLREISERQKREGIKHWDWAWIQTGRKKLDGCWRPIKSWKVVSRGKKKGQIKIELYYPEGRKVVVPANHMKFWS